MDSFNLLFGFVLMCVCIVFGACIIGVFDVACYLLQFTGLQGLHYWCSVFCISITWLGVLFRVLFPIFFQPVDAPADGDNYEF